MPRPLWVATIAGLAIFIFFSILARFSPAIVRRLLGGEARLEIAVKVAGRAVAGAMVLVGVFVGLGAVLGSQEVALTGIVLGTIVASLGVQDLLKNYVSGFYVLLERNIRVGDVVTVGAFRGTVTDVRVRVTFLRGDDGALVVVPNSELFNNVVVVQAAGGGAPERGVEPPREVR